MVVELVNDEDITIAPSGDLRTAMARFPFQTTIESFDFRFQPSPDPKLNRELSTGRFIADGDNLLLLGPPGVGKTHPAVPSAPGAVHVRVWHLMSR